MDDFRNQKIIKVPNKYLLQETDMKEKVFTGMSLRKAIEFAYRIGCSVRHPNRTGELIIGHHLAVKSVRINARRKDAPRSLTSFISAIYGNITLH